MFDLESSEVAMAESQMKEEVYNVWFWIRRSKGKSPAINVGTIAELEGMSDRKVRRIVKKLIEDYDLPIASSIAGTTGYFIPQTKAERDEYIRVLNANIRSTAKRLHAFDSNTADDFTELANKVERQLSITE